MNGVMNSVAHSPPPAQSPSRLWGSGLLNGRPGYLFSPTVNDSDRIYEFLQEQVESKKALSHTLEEVEYQLRLPERFINAIEDENGKVAGINIAYPADQMDEIARALKWRPEHGFDRDTFHSRAIYSELRVVDRQYHRNGVGNLLRAKQVRDVTDRGFLEILIFSIPEKEITNTGFGFQVIARENITYNDLAPGPEADRVSLMRLRFAEQNSREKAESILAKYDLEPRY